MAFLNPSEPYAEEYQTNTYNGFPFQPEYGHRRNAPAEEPFIVHRRYPNGDRGWYQGDRRLRGLKSKKYWVRPHDGARRGTMGRLKDALTGEGADVFVMANADRRTFHRDMPKRHEWSNWSSLGHPWLHDPNWRAAHEDMDWYPTSRFAAPWAKRDRGEVYNFRTREYDRFSRKNRDAFWSDAHYGPRGRKTKYDLPQCWRESNGVWHSSVPRAAGLHAGGRPLYPYHGMPTF